MNAARNRGAREWLLPSIAATCLAFASAVNADWQRDDESIAWHVRGQPLWRFSFDPSKGKPFFDVLSAGGPSLITFQPEDHPWHYGLWFSWKYVNGANYWEEDRKTGRAEGATRWRIRDIDARPNGGATLRLDLTYTHPSGRVDLTESRELQISAPAADGSYLIDWRARFTAGEQGAILDRTPMPNEPNGQVNGGYAGLGLRAAGPPAVMSVMTAQGPVAQFASDRARPSAPIVGINLEQSGGVAIWSDPANIAADAPWYIVRQPQGMRFVCAAILAPKIRTLPARGEWRLHYRIAVQADPWTADALEAAANRWR
jgi:Methane oxygenase PmoA